VTARTGIKTAPEKTPARERRVFSWPDVLRVLSDDRARSYVLEAFKALGGNRDDLRGSSLVALREALTRAEDRLEGERPRFDRSALRALRRRIEDATP